MQPSKRRTAAVVLLCVLILQLSFSGMLGRFARLLAGEEMAHLLLFLQTGRTLPGNEPPQVTQPEPTQALLQEQPEPLVQAVFSEGDALGIDLHNETNYTPNLEKLLLQPLEWNLRGEEPTVLILHTHATESYTPTEEDTYTPSSQNRTLDKQNNMIRVGQRLAQGLQRQGIQVIHDTTLHDYPSYTGSYSQARKTIRSYLERYPSICLVLDLHRDAVEFADGTQLTTFRTLRGEETARLMMVVGTNDGGLSHPNWERNLALALKLHAQLEKQSPGSCRFLNLRQERFNQDLSAGAMLIEVGAAGDTLTQALRAADLLADAIGALALGATADSAK